MRILSLLLAALVAVVLAAGCSATTTVAVEPVPLVLPTPAADDRAPTIETEQPDTQQARSAPAEQDETLLDEPAKQTRVETEPISTLPSSWSAPPDAERVIRRIIMTGRWAGRQDPSVRQIGPDEPDGCYPVGAIPSPAANTVVSRQWRPGGGDAALGVQAFVFDDDQQAHDWATSGREQLLACVVEQAVAGVVPSIRDEDVSMTVLEQAEYVGEVYELDASLYAGHRFVWEGRETEMVTVFARHHHIGFLLTMETSANPTRYDAAGWAELLRKFDIAVSSPPFVEATNSNWLDADQFEEMMVREFRERAFDYAEDADCILGETLRLMSGPDDVPPGAVMSYVVRWCSADVIGRRLAQDPRRVVGLDDVDKQACYGRVRIESQLKASVLDTIQARDEPKPDPFGSERAALDARLLAECGINADEGVIAGLDPREPLDDSPEREPFCTGWSEGLGLDSYELDQMEEVDRLVTSYRAIAAQVDRLTPPPTISDQWRRYGEYHTEKARVHEVEQIGEVAIYTHDEFQEFADGIDNDRAWAEIKEYLRINCGKSF